MNVKIEKGKLFIEIDLQEPKFIRFVYRVPTTCILQYNFSSAPNC